MKKVLVKTCYYCGRLFTRREDETQTAFLKRKKCHKGCIKESDAKTTVLGFYAKSEPETGDCGISECHMFTRAWFSQNRHWCNRYC